MPNVESRVCGLYYYSSRRSRSFVSKNILLLNREAPAMNETKARRDMNGKKVRGLLRVAGMNQPVAIKRVCRM